MRSQDNRHNKNGNRAQAYAGSNDRNNYGENTYNDYDREHNDYERRYNDRDRSDAGRYANYEGNYGRGNYQNYYNDYDRNNYSNDRNAYGTGRSGYGSGSQSRSWDSKEPGYYDRNETAERNRYTDYNGTRRRDEKDWGDGRNYAASYDDYGNYNRYDDDRSFFGRVGDRIRNTWHDITDRDDTHENMRRFKQRGDEGENDYNRGNYRPYPAGSSDSHYGTSGRNNSRPYSDSSNENRYGNSEWRSNRNTYGNNTYGSNAYGSSRQGNRDYGVNREDLGW